MQNSVILKNKLKVLFIEKKPSSPIFKGVSLGDEIELKYHLFNAVAGTSGKVEIMVNGVPLGENKVSQLRTNLLNFECQAERTLKGEENSIVREGRTIYPYSPKEFRLATINLHLFSTFRVKSIKKKTSSKFLETLKEGDKFSIGVDMNSKGSTFVSFYNENGAPVHKASGATIKKTLSNCFELEEVEWDSFS